MSRRSKRSSTALSSKATAALASQNRDAGAVKRLMTGRFVPAPAAAAVAVPTAAKRRAAVPFTCYRCGESLAQSDYATHPCMSKLRLDTHTWAASQTVAQHELEGSLGERRQSAEAGDPKAAPGCPLVDETATPASSGSAPQRREEQGPPRAPAHSELWIRGAEGDEAAPASAVESVTPAETTQPAEPAEPTQPAELPAEPVRQTAEPRRMPAATAAPRRRSGRASTQATSKAAASLSYQREHRCANAPTRGPAPLLSAASLRHPNGGMANGFGACRAELQDAIAQSVGSKPDGRLKGNKRRRTVRAQTSQQLRLADHALFF